MIKYIIENRETGDYIEEFDTLEDAEKCIEEFIEEDKKKGIYKNDFYEIFTAIKV